MKLRKILAVFMVLAIVMGTVSFGNAPVSANPTDVVRVQIAGHFVDFEGQAPIIQNDRVLVPVRGVFTLMGFEPTWSDATTTATLYDGTTTIIIPIGQPSFTVNGVVVTPDVPQQNIEGRVLIPLRAVNQAIGGDAQWDPVNRIATIIPPPELMERVLVNLGVTQPPPQTQPPSITTTALPNGTTGREYNQTLAATGATPIVWSVASGNLPAGLSLNSNAGTITGTPTQAGTFSFVISAENADGYDMAALSIVVEAGREEPFVYTESAITLPNRRLTDTERQNWIAEYMENGGASAFELEVIRLTNLERAEYGLSPLAICHTLMLAARFYAQTMANLNTGLGHRYGPYGGSFGTADAFGDRVTGVRAANGHGGTWTPEATVAGWMNSSGHRANILNPNLTRMGTGSHLGGGRGVYHYQLFGAGAATPVPGATGTRTITFNANGGTGTMQPQTFSHGVAQNLRGNTFTRTGYSFAGWRSSPTGAAQYTNEQSISITSNRTLYAVWTTAVAPTITTATLPNARVGQAYNQTLAATGATPITWSVTSGNLPQGLSLNANTGAITGTPTTTGTFTFTVRAQNSLGNVTRQLSIVVDAAATVAVPNVVGMTEAAARGALEAVGFTVVVRDQFSSATGIGNVISQTPAAGTSQNYNTTVHIYVNRGVDTVTGITIRSTPRESYNVDDTFSYTGLGLDVAWASGQTTIVTSNFTLTHNGSAISQPWVLDTPGTHTITVTYGGQSTTFTITVS